MHLCRHNNSISIATKNGFREKKKTKNHCGLSMSSPKAHTRSLLACVYRIKARALVGSFSIPILINNNVVSFGIALLCIWMCRRLVWANFLANENEETQQKSIGSHVLCCQTKQLSIYRCSTKKMNIDNNRIHTRVTRTLRRILASILCALE